MTDAAPDDAESGFSLIEALVALAIFSTAALALVAATAQSVRAAALVETRALAALEADARLTEAWLRGGRGPLSGEGQQGGRRFGWQVRVQRLGGGAGGEAGAGLLHLSAEVRGQDGRLLATRHVLAAPPRPPAPPTTPGTGTGTALDLTPGAEGAGRP